MDGKFGRNGDRVERFMEAARALTFEDAQRIAAHIRTPEVKAAQERMVSARFSASQGSAISAANAKLVKSLLQKFPAPTTTAERMPINRFTISLREAVFALASRPQNEDDTISARSLTCSHSRWASSGAHGV